LSPSGLFQLGLSTLIFLGAASMAKSWALGPSPAKMIATLALYTLGNLIMLRLVREFGMGVAFSLSAVIQLIAVNLVAFAVFGERVGTVEAAGIALAILSVAAITLGPQIGGR
jgi:multidrug transporter EmrE-like cation transporter